MKETPIVISEDEVEAINVEVKPIENIKDEEPAQCVNVIEEVQEEAKPKDNIKVVELVQCEKCGKKLTKRTLTYIHSKVCPGNENKPSPQPRRNILKVEQTIEEVTPPKMDRIQKRSQKINQLFANAV